MFTIKKTTRITKNNMLFFIKKNIKYIIPILIIIIGICIMVFPWYKAWRFDYLQHQALNMWEKAILSGEITPNGTMNSNGQWSSSKIVVGDFINENGVWEEDINPNFNLNYLLDNMEGVIIIEKINLKSVILKPASKYNLDISICAVISSRVMGQTGNYILAGHYSRIYGRHLNRVRELLVGDIITVDNSYEKFDYSITEIFSVEPSEVWVMDNDDSKSLITLITCDYEKEPYNRLIIRGEIKN